VTGEAVDTVRVEGVAEIAARVSQDIADGPIVPFVTPDEIRRRLSQYDFRAPVVLDKVVADVEDMMRRWNVQVTHPRYFGLFNPSVHAAAVVADALVAAYNPQLATWRTSPAANEIERHTLAWLAGKFGLPDDAVANFTTGGAEANLSAVVVALTRAFPEYGEQGVGAISGQPAIYLTGESHHSFSKIAHMTGLGRRALRAVPVDETLRMDVAALRARVEDDRANGFVPVMVVGTAGTTGGGAIDPLPALAEFCRNERLWFHVDAAWGGAAVLSPRLRSHLRGIEHADSITCDAHKWFSVPMGAGMFFCRHRDSVREAFRADTSYMPGKTSDVLDPFTSTVQWSRRFIGLKLFFALAAQGEAGYVEAIERQARLGDLLRECLHDAGWTIVNSTPLPLVCFRRDGVVPSTFLKALYEQQIAWISEVRLGGAEPVLRACITSFRTTDDDVRDVVRAMTALARSQAEGA
jgi:glutamate/tyrosine decarboxylase-like PLP-dependent enzyme